MSEKFDYVSIRDNSTLKESFELPLEEILNLKDNNFLETYERIDKLVKYYIPNFDAKYKIAGGTTLRINDTNYPFPVLTTAEHDSQFFPELLEYDGIATLNYHILTFEKIKSKK